MEPVSTEPGLQARQTAGAAAEQMWQLMSVHSKKHKKIRTKTLIVRYNLVSY